MPVHECLGPRAYDAKEGPAAAYSVSGAKVASRRKYEESFRVTAVAGCLSSEVATTDGALTGGHNAARQRKIESFHCRASPFGVDDDPYPAGVERVRNKARPASPRKSTNPITAAGTSSRGSVNGDPQPPRLSDPANRKLFAVRGRAPDAPDAHHTVTSGKNILIGEVDGDHVTYDHMVQPTGGAHPW